MNHSSGADRASSTLRRFQPLALVAALASSSLHCSSSADGAVGTSARGGAHSLDVSRAGSAALGGATGAPNSGGAPAAGDGAAATEGSGATSGASAPPQMPRKRAFLLLGQSNMAGYPQALAEDKMEDSRIQVLGYDNCAATGRATDQWDAASAPLHACWSGALGPGDYFAKGLLSALPDDDTIGLVPCAIPGERIETFLKAGGTKYSWIVSRAKVAQSAGYEIEGILFHQGESNCGDLSWPGKVKTLISDLRSDLSLGEVPFLPGELLYTGCGGHNALVHQLSDIISNTHVVSAAGLVVAPDDTWNLHFSHDSVVTQGGRYAQVMTAALGL